MTAAWSIACIFAASALWAPVALVGHVLYNLGDWTLMLADWIDRNWIR